MPQGHQYHQGFGFGQSVQQPQPVSPVYQQQQQPSSPQYQRQYQQPMSQQQHQQQHRAQQQPAQQPTAQQWGAPPGQRQEFARADSAQWRQQGQGWQQEQGQPQGQGHQQQPSPAESRPHTSVATAPVSFWQDPWMMSQAAASGPVASRSGPPAGNVAAGQQHTALSAAAAQPSLDLRPQLLTHHHQRQQPQPQLQQQRQQAGSAASGGMATYSPQTSQQQLQELSSALLSAPADAQPLPMPQHSTAPAQVTVGTLWALSVCISLPLAAACHVPT